MDQNNKLILLCYHCGNLTPHTKLVEQVAYYLYEQIDEEEFHESFSFFVYSCSTCNGITVMGGFMVNPKQHPSYYPRLYPIDTKFGKDVPTRIAKAYNEALAYSS